MPVVTVSAVIILVIQSGNCVHGAPVFQELTFSHTFIFNVDEGPDPNPFIANITAIDTAGGPVTYHLEGSDADFFEIDASSGTLRATEPLDADTGQTSYNELRVVATGKRDSTFANIIIIVNDINDNAPIFRKKTYEASVPEDVPVEHFVKEVIADDADSSPQFSRVTYFIIGGDPNGHFKIQTSNNKGRVYTNAPLDFGSNSAYTLILEGRDGGTPPLTGNATLEITIINVNNFAPEFGKDSYNVTVPEDIPIGTSILNVSVWDLDSGISGQFTLSLTEGSSPTSRFGITSDGSIFTTADLRFIIQDNSLQYNLQITATDKAVEPKSTTVPLSIFVRDVNLYPPELDEELYTASISEFTLVGQKVLRVSATDKDRPGTNDSIFHFYLEDPDNIAPNMFQIHPETGIIRVAEELDHGKVPFIQLLVYAKDFGKPRLMSEKVPVEITIQSEGAVPTFGNQSFLTIKLPRKTNQGTQLINLNATAVSGRDTTGFQYSITSVTTSGFLTVNSTTGELKLVNSFCDFSGTTFVVSVTVLGTGRNPKTAVSVITIQIQEENTADPFFATSSVSTSLITGSNTGTVVFTATATDPDADCGPTDLTYSIVEGNVGNVFTIHRRTGVLSTARELTADLPSSFDLTIEADDGGLPTSRQGVMTLHVVIASKVLPRFSISGRGFMIGGPEMVGSETVHPFGLFADKNVLVTGTVSVDFGKLSASGNFRDKRMEADTVRAVLLTKEVWYDDRQIRVAVQVRDEQLSSRLQNTIVQVDAVPIGDLIDVNPNGVQGQCTTNVNTGVCSVALPLLASSSFVPGKSYQVQVRYQISGKGAMVNLDRVNLRPRTEVASDLFQDNIVQELPGRPVYRGQQFRATIAADVTYSVTTFTLSFTTDENIRLHRMNIDDKWTVVITTSGQTTVVAASLKSPESAPQGEVGRQELFTIDYRVEGTATENALASMTMKIEGVSSTRVQRVRIRGESGTVDGTFISRTGTGLTGHMYVASNDVVGVIAFATQAQLVNLARLTGSTQSSGITAQACFVCHRTSATAACASACQSIGNAECTSADNSVLSVGPNCQARLTGDETTGAASVDVTVTVGDVFTTVPFRVWYPETPIELGVSDSSLGQFSDFLDEAAGCNNPVFQSADVQARARFSYSGSGPSFTVDVTDVIKGHLQVSNGNVQLRTSGPSPTITGQSSGTTVVSVVTDDGRTVGTREVTVSTNPVSIIDMNVIVASELKLLSPQSTESYDRVSQELARAQFDLNLDVEEKQGFIIASAVADDGTRISVTAANGLKLSSSDTDVLSVGDDEVMAGAFSGTASLTASWEGCNTVFASRVVDVPVTLRDPIGVEITGVRERIVWENDPLASLGTIFTWSPVKVELIFEGNQRRDVTEDDRVEYRLENSGGLFKVQRVDGKQRIVPNADGEVGVGQLFVTLINLNETMMRNLPGNSVNVRVVKLDNVRVFSSPYPSYSGSGNHEETTLSLIRPTTVRQQARLAMTLDISDGTTANVNNHPASDYVMYVPDTTTKNDSVVEVVSVSPERLMRPLNEGVIDLVGSFASIEASRVRITVDDQDPVFVTELQSFQFTNTLTGFVNEATSQAKIGCKLSDGTEFEVLIRNNGDPVLPGLLEFSLSTTDPATVDPERGTVTLRGNYHELVTLTASAVETSVSRTRDFACNLRPTFGDVDIGRGSGIPAGPAKIGDTLTLDVVINVASTPFGAFTFRLLYDDSKLKAVDNGMSNGASWGGGPMVAQINDPPGVYVISGSPSGNNEQGDYYHVSTIRFEVTGSGLTEIRGIVENLVEADTVSGQTPIGEPDREFIAGNIIIALSNGNRRRREGEEQMKSFSPPASYLRYLEIQATARNRRGGCDELPTGDANGDCTFDIVDVSYTMQYVVEALVDFSGTFGAAFTANPPVKRQLDNMDADRNGVIDNIDAFYLAKTSVQLSRFLNDLRVKPINGSYDSGCILYIEAKVLRAGDVPDQTPENAQQTRVFFDLASTSSAMTSQFDESVDDCERCIGGKVSGINHVGQGNKVFGGILRAERVDMDQGLYAAAIQTDMTMDSVGEIGLSVIIVTLNSNLRTDATRIEFLSGPPESVQPLVYDDTIEFMLSVTEDQSLSISVPGYNPLQKFENTIGTSGCTNNFPPKFTSHIYNISVLEDVPPETVVGHVLATDDDVGPAGEVRYSIVERSDNPVTFEIDEVSGEIRTVLEMNRAVIPRYLLTVEARDGTYPFRTARADVLIVLIDVNIHAPVFEEHLQGDALFVPATNTSLAEYLANVRIGALPGTVVLQVNSSDLDLGNNSIVRYSFASVTDKISDEYWINAVTGEIVVRSIVVRERAEALKFSIVATDLGGLATHANVTFNFVFVFDILEYASIYRGLRGEFRASLGSGTATRMLSGVNMDITRIRAELITTRVYFDEPHVRVAGQVRDILFGRPRLLTAVKMRVVPGPGLAGALGISDVESASVESTCLTGQSDTISSLGMCLASVELPSTWFEVSGSEVRTVDVYAGFEDERQPLVQLPSVELVMKQAWTLERNVLVEVPSHPVYKGQTVRVPVWAHAEFAVSGFQLTFQIGDGIKIAGISLDSNRWSGPVTRLSDQRYGVNAILREPSKASSEAVTGPEKLVEVVLVVVGESKDAVRVDCTVEFLSSIKETSFWPGGKQPPVSALFVDRSYTTSSGPKQFGRLFVVHDTVRAVFGVLETSTVINRAMLNGKRQEEDLHVVSARVFGGLSVVTGNSFGSLHCESQHPAVWGVAADCSKVVLQGYETEGALSAGVKMSLYDAATNTTIDGECNGQVWAPDLPVEVTADMPRLLRVADWEWFDSESGQCRGKFQDTRIHAFATYRRGFGTAGVRVRVSEDVSDVLESRDTNGEPSNSVVMSGRTARGYVPGDATVAIVNPVVPDRRVGNTTIQVVDISVRVAELELFVFTGMRVEPLFSPFTGQPSGSVVAVQQQLDREQKVGRVAAFARFVDETRMVVGPELGLYINVDEEYQAIVAVPSTDDNTYNNRHVIAVGNGHAYVHGFWRVSCGQNESELVDLASNRTGVEVKIPQPNRVQLEGVKSQLTLPGDAAADAGKPTEIELSVALVYEVGHGQEQVIDMEKDPRTVYDLREANGLFSICEDVEAIECSPEVGGTFVNVVRPRSNITATGVGFLVIRFTHVDVIANISIEVVKASGLQLTLRPYPAYPGSTNASVSVLRKYWNPNDDAATVRQESRAEVLLELTNNERLDVTSTSSVLFFEPDTRNPEVGVLSVSDEKILRVRSQLDSVLLSRDAEVDVYATFSGLETSTRRVRVTNNLATMTKLIDIRVVGKPVVDGAYVLETVPGGSASFVAMGAEFDDGTQRLDFVDESTGNELLPGSLSYDVIADVGNPVAIDGKGAITLLGNHASKVEIRVGILDSFVSGGAFVICNLLPVAGDFDLGFSGGYAIPRQIRDEEFELPVVVNTGGKNLGAIDLEIRYSTSHLEVVSGAGGPQIMEGSGWTKGIFQAVVDPPGVIRVGGAVDPEEEVSGSSIQLARIRFRSVAATPDRNPVQFRGRVITFSENTLQGATIGSSTPRDTKAGEVYVEISILRRRRDFGSGTDGRLAIFEPLTISLPTMSSTTVRTRRSMCDSPPCADCQRRFPGDANGDCVFDMRDVSYTQIYLAERAFDFERVPQGVAIKSQLIDTQLIAMDADLNGEINLADVRLMAAVNFNLQRFLMVDVHPVQYPFSRGLLTVNVSLEDINLQIETAAVYVLLTHPDSGLQGNVSDSVLEMGRLADGYDAANGSTNVLFRADRYPPLFNDYATLERPGLCSLPRASGDLSCNEGEVVQRFRYQSNQGRCVAFEYYGCDGNENNFKTRDACQLVCEPKYRYSVQMKADFIASELGVSVLVVTFDTLGLTSLGRKEFLSGSAINGSHMFPGRLAFSVFTSAEGSSTQSAAVDVLASNGYSPLVDFSNDLRSVDAVNEFAPVIMPNENVSIYENLTRMGVIVVLNVTDADPGQTEQVTLTLDGGIMNEETGFIEAGRVALDPRDGIVYLIETVDYEIPSQREFRFSVIASDNSPPWARTTRKEYVVSVIDVNDNAPIFTQRSYGASISFDAAPGTVVLRVKATDADSNTPEGGMNAKISYSLRPVGDVDTSVGFEIDSDTGEITTTGIQSRSLSETIELIVTATDHGNPPLSSEARIVIAVINDDFLVTITTRPGIDEFRTRINGTTGKHPCLTVLEEILNGEVIVLEILPNFASPFDQTDITFYVVDFDTGDVFRTSEVNDKLDSVEDFGECSMRNIDESEIFDTFISFYSDDECLLNKGVPVRNAEIREHKTCLYDEVASLGARVSCSREGEDDNSVVSASIRVYDSENCQTLGDYDPALIASVDNDACVSVVLNSQTIHLRARCLERLSTSSPSASRAPLEIIGYVAAGLVFILLVIFVIFRWQQRRKFENEARKMVLANRGDVLFGTPERMRRNPEGNAGLIGEIDPKTGEVVRYKETAAAIEKHHVGGKGSGDWGTGSMFGGLRNNPLYGTSGFVARGPARSKAEQHGHSEFVEDSLSDNTSLASTTHGSNDDEGDADSLLGDLSDFETFEEDMFGGNSRIHGHHRNPPMFAVEFDDDLSDFDELGDGENASESHEEYLHMDSSEEDTFDDDDLNVDDIHLNVEDMFEGEQPVDSSRGILKLNNSAPQNLRVTFGGSFGESVDEDNFSGSVNMRKNINSRRRKEITSMDIESELVTPHVQFEDVATPWQTTQQSIAEVEESDMNLAHHDPHLPSQPEFSDSAVDPGISSGSHFHAVKKLWQQRRSQQS